MRCRPGSRRLARTLPLSMNRTYYWRKRATSPRPSPPLCGGEGEESVCGRFRGSKRENWFGEFSPGPPGLAVASLRQIPGAAVQTAGWKKTKNIGFASFTVSPGGWRMGKSHGGNKLGDAEGAKNHPEPCASIHRLSGHPSTAMGLRGAWCGIPERIRVSKPVRFALCRLFSPFCGESFLRSGSFRPLPLASQWGAGRGSAESKRRRRSSDPSLRGRGAVRKGPKGRKRRKGGRRVRFAVRFGRPTALAAQGLGARVARGLVGLGGLGSVCVRFTKYGFWGEKGGKFGLSGLDRFTVGGGANRTGGAFYRRDARGAEAWE